MTKARKFAEGTSVPVERTIGEIRALIDRHGATGFAFGEQGDRAFVAFVMHKRQLRFLLPLKAPPPAKPSWSYRAPSKEAIAAELRRRWRALLLVMKAKLEAVASGIVEFDREFLPFIVTDGGVTVGDRVMPRIDEMLAGARVPNLLGPGTGES